MDNELKQLMEGLQREIELLKALVKAKDDLIQNMKFAPAPIVIREQHQMIPYMAPYMAPYIQPLITTPCPILQPPFVITCDSIKDGMVTADKLATTAIGGLCTNPTNGLFLVNSKAK